MNRTEDELLRVITRAYTQAQRMQASCCGTTATQCQILCTIGVDGSVPQAELQTRLGLEKSWVSRAIDGLVKEGLVERRTCCADARMYDVAFTEAGRRRFEELNDALNVQAASVMERIPVAERPGVRRALELLADAVSSMETECHCGTTAPSAAGRRITICNAAADDRDGVAALLRSVGLPEAGFDEHLGNFIIVDGAKGPVACAGFERRGRYALIRSVAVAKRARRRGFGTELAHEVERRAAAAGVEEAYLLTEGARGFWERLGYAVAERSDAPAEIRKSAEFLGACPNSAVMMHKRLGGIA